MKFLMVEDLPFALILSFSSCAPFRTTPQPGNHGRSLHPRRRSRHADRGRRWSERSNSRAIFVIDDAKEPSRIKC